MKVGPQDDGGVRLQLMDLFHGPFILLYNGIVIISQLIDPQHKKYGIEFPGT